MKVFVIGSRGSALALWQARWIENRLQAAGQETRIEIIKTTGDKITDVTLAKVGAASGGKGVFTKEIEEALLAGAIDLAVHSLKDLPTELPAGLTLAAVPEREDPRDALVGFRLDELPKGARVGTSSLRRAAQMRALRPDVTIGDIRGNVETRLRKRDEGEHDATLLACAGLRRLGLEGRITEALDPAVMAPAVGQGALGIEIREGDEETLAVLKPIEHEATRQAVEAERALLEALGGGCQVPLGAHAHAEAGELQLVAAVVAPDGSRVIRTQARGPLSRPRELGRSAAEALLRDGAAALIAAAEVG
jgi:hydroxymethylbilane synthase